MTIEELQAQVAQQATRISELNAESAKHRINHRDATAALESVTGERDAIRGELEKAKPLAAKAVDLEKQFTATAAERDSLRDSVKQVRTQAALKVAAITAGIVDLDALKLIDMASVAVDDAGEVKDADKLMADLKTAKPYLFGVAAPVVPPPVKVTTSNPTAPPKPATATERERVKAMTDKEFAEAERTRAWAK